jgi:hypothetical protein
MPYTLRSLGTRLGAAAHQDLRQKEYFAGVLRTDNDKIDLAGANPGPTILQGIIVGNPEADGDAGLQIDGIHYAVLGASVTRNQRLAPNASSELIPATTGQVSYFRALETVTVGAGAPAGQAVAAVKIGDPTAVA